LEGLRERDQSEDFGIDKDNTKMDFRVIRLRVWIGFNYGGGYVLGIIRVKGVVWI
jgi:hypothetical protein